MTQRERVLQSLRHQQPDICPYHIRFTGAALDKLKQATGNPNVLDTVGNHIAYMPTRAPNEEVEIRPGFIRDEFGVVWNRTTEKDVGVVEDYLVTPENLDKVPFPDPKSPGRFDYVRRGCEANPDLFRLATRRFTLFERAWSLRGMANLLMDMAADEDFVDALFDRILDFDLAVVDEALKFPIDGFHFGDDWGQQKGLMMGPRLWRRFIKPRLARLFERVKKAGKFVSIHSCGDLRDILPDLIDIGLDIFNPFQPEVMDIFETKKKYGEKLTFWGGVSTQKTLPYGTPQDVKSEIARNIKQIGKNGGYICAPAHDIPADVPVENIQALLFALQNQERF